MSPAHLVKKPGIVTIVLAMLILSLGLRVGVAAVTSAGAEGDHDDMASLPEAGMQCSEPAMAAMLDDLLAREKRLQAAEAAAASREAEIKAGEARLAAGLDAMKAAEARIEGTLAALSDAQEGDVAALVATYEAMKPDQAARVFATMSPDFAAEFLRRMKPEAAAPILAGLDPEKAYALSVLMAGRAAARIEAATAPEPTEPVAGSSSGDAEEARP